MGGDASRYRQGARQGLPRRWLHAVLPLPRQQPAAHRAIHFGGHALVTRRWLVTAQLPSSSPPSARIATPPTPRMVAAGQFDLLAGGCARPARPGPTSAQALLRHGLGRIGRVGRTHRGGQSRHRRCTNARDSAAGLLFLMKYLEIMKKC